MQFSRSGAFVGGIAVAVVIGGGTAVATNGAGLLIGKGNVATATTGLVNSKGTPLSLAAKKGAAPLKVNSTVKVKSLNSDLLDGKDSTAFLAKTAKAADSAKLNGQDASAYLNAVYVAQTFSVNGQHPKPDNSVMDSVVVPPGTYQLMFTADISNVAPGNAEYGCQLNFVAGGVDTQGFYGNTLVSQNTGYGAAAVLQVARFTAITTINASCHTNLGNSGNLATAYNSSLVATQVQGLTGIPVPAAPAAVKPLGKAKASSKP